MNIFRLDNDPRVAARMHCDKHVVKMILEYAQLLSTAHRLLDGRRAEALNMHRVKGQRYKQVFWLFDGENVITENRIKVVDGVEMSKHVFVIENPQCYNIAHANHPSNIWARTSSENYSWLFALWHELMIEYHLRYGKIHACRRYMKKLIEQPVNIRVGAETPLPLAMPDEYKVDDAVTSYQNYYVGSKASFAKWTARKPPEWFTTRIPEYDEADFYRARELAERASQGS